MLVSTVLVLLMVIPGLALFYGGLVRAKNMLSVLSQVFVIVAVVSIIWVIYGYSLAFTNGRRAQQLHRRLLEGLPDGRRCRMRPPRPSPTASSSLNMSTSCSR
jgi:ammonia channel protein AmtB